MMGWLKKLPTSTAFWLTLVAVVLVCSIVLPAVGWGWLRSGASESGMESHSTTVRNIGFIVAGVLALVFAVWRGVLAQRQAETAQRQSETSQHQSETSQQGLLNERYQRGAEMLGSDILTVRLGGIYALQRLAEERPEQYHIQIMQLFCAFVRLPTKDQSLESGQVAIKPGTLLGIRQDVEAIMQAIGSRSELRIAMERGVEFRLDFRGVDLRDGQLLDADLSYAMFHHADLSNVNFANTDLTYSYLSFADLSQATFRNVNFTGVHIQFANLSGAMLQGADLPWMDFNDVNLTGTNLSRANLSGAVFGNANAANASFESSNLSRAGFLRADLSGARLARADLSGAHFVDADLNRTNFADANLSGAEFSVDGGQAAKGLTQVQLDQAWADTDTPPKLKGVLDADTGEQLVWQGKPVNDDSVEPDG